MKLSKRILRAINEGVARGLNFSLDDEEDDEMYTKSNADKKIQNLDKHVEKEYYSKKLQEMLIDDPMDVNAEFIKYALKLHELCGALYNPHLDEDDFKDFILKCISIQGYNVNLNWIDTSDVTDMSYLFENSTFNGIISHWDVFNVISMCGMFQDSTFNNDISNWDVSNVTNMESMFAWSKFDRDISSWDVASVTNMYAMFYSCEFNHDISNWNITISNSKNVINMFDNCSIKEEYKPKFNYMTI